MPRFDPLAINEELPLEETFHPAGFLLRITTNSELVLEAARESWGHYPAQLRACDGLELRVMVRPEGPLAVVPSHRAQGHLYSVVSDMHNFASLDLERLCGTVWISQATARDRLALRWFFVESLAYMLLAQRYVVPVHAACVARDGRAVLLAGHSTAGKSTLAYACSRSGWTYLSDDAVFLLPGDGSRTAIGRHRQFRFRADAQRLFPELARFAARVRPNGKIAMEVPVEELPQVKAAERACVGSVVLLERQGGEPGLSRIGGEAVVECMLRDMPSYGPSVDAMHERAVRGVVGESAWRLRYWRLEEALARLEEVWG